MGVQRYSRLLPNNQCEPRSCIRQEWPCSVSDAVHQVSARMEKEPVLLHVYDVTGNTAVKGINSLLSTIGTGAFHIGVEVYGREWSYGYDERGDTGVFCCQPRGCDAHSYVKVLEMGDTTFKEYEVRAVIERLAAEWQGQDYDLLRCNCCHFSDELCRQLGVGPVPRWVTSLAGAGEALDDKLHRATAGAQAAAEEARTFFAHTHGNRFRAAAARAASRASSMAKTARRACSRGPWPRSSSRCGTSRGMTYASI
mmetsp:Transcript_8342/g.15358  ORF Transcript_8342/g.15358 Transcript_8342/m.15358 type:complete len:254 (+) Transcript_8342:83-844(+)